MAFEREAHELAGDTRGRTELSNRAGTKTLREPFLAGAGGGRDAGALL